MKQKLTPWIDGRIKPERVGVYERDYGPVGDPDCAYALWNGKHWMIGCGGIERAAKAPYRSKHSSLPWRGLASNPEGRK